jgi:hypothetical protein
VTTLGAPALNSTWPVVSGASRSGAFSGHDFGSVSYNTLYPSTGVTLEVSAPVSPSISVSNVPANALVGQSFTPTFDYAGDGATSVTSNTTSTCTVSGGQVHFIAPPTCTIVAHATATADYAASTGEPQSFTITEAASGITDLGDGKLWFGLRNSDDQGTQFDVKMELYVGDTLVASGLTRCVTGLTRNAMYAKNVTVPWRPFSPTPVGPNDVLTVRLSARIGTNPDGSKCPGPGGSHASAVGLRFYYDASNRQSQFGATIAPNPSTSEYFHSDGGACDTPVATRESPGVTTRFTDTNAPGGSNQAKCKDSGVVKFSGGNLWSPIGTWTLT